jgi:Aminotransferase class I and II
LGRAATAFLAVYLMVASVYLLRWAVVPLTDGNRWHGPGRPARRRRLRAHRRANPGIGRAHLPRRQRQETFAIRPAKLGRAGLTFQQGQGLRWPNFRMMARLVHAAERLYPLRPELGFLPAAEDLEPAVGPRTRAIVLNSPSNPLGTIIGADRLSELLDLAAAHDLWVISDECYDAITFDGTFASPAAVGHPDRVISCYSFSKTSSCGRHAGSAPVLLAGSRCR